MFKEGLNLRVKSIWYDISYVGHTNQDTITKFKRKFRNSEYETR